MTHPLPIRAPGTLQDPDLAADLRRDLGADVLFYICAVEAALGVQIDGVEMDGVQIHESAEIGAQLETICLEEAA